MTNDDLKTRTVAQLCEALDRAICWLSSTERHNAEPFIAELCRRAEANDAPQPAAAPVDSTREGVLYTVLATLAAQLGYPCLETRGTESLADALVRFATERLREVTAERDALRAAAAPPAPAAPRAEPAPPADDRDEDMRERVNALAFDLLGGYLSVKHQEIISRWMSETFPPAPRADAGDGVDEAIDALADHLEKPVGWDGTGSDVTTRTSFDEALLNVLRRLAARRGGQ